MTISAKIIADSIGPKTPRLTTMELRYNRFIHAEFMTHRVFSRNASSSRAIPVERQIQSIIEDTAMPMHWGKNQPGMQANEEQNALIYDGAVSSLDMIDNRFDGVTREAAWLKARDNAIAVARAFHSAGYHKQIVNRILEPFSHITVVVTATDYTNFFGLRRHPDAQPEIRALADAMYEAMEASTPTFLEPGQWHLPYVPEHLIKHLTSMENVQYAPEPLSLDDLIKVSVARCARVSYKTHDGKEPTMAEDLALYDRLVGAQPLHASPAEHQATPDEMVFADCGLPVWKHPELSGNFEEGWIQFRKTLPHEHIRTYEDAD